MSGLFTSLSAAARSLEAQRLGLDTVGQNLANINTAGYTRRQIDLVEVAATEHPRRRRGRGGGGGGPGGAARAGRLHGAAAVAGTAARTGAARGGGTAGHPAGRGR